MAHNLEIYGGQASMMYVDDPPWHGLGTQLDGPATAEEAIRAARLDWAVGKIPLAAYNGSKWREVPGQYAIVREDRWGQGSDDAVLGAVGGDYMPLQNAEAFQFFDPIVGQNAAVYHTAGALGRGERIWILAKLPEGIRVVGDDITDKYLLLCNSHDGTSAVQVKFTPIRVVCQNTLTMALKTGSTLRIPHTRSMQERLAQADELLGIVHKHYDTIAEQLQAMARVQLNGQRLDEYLEKVFRLPPGARQEKARRRVLLDRVRAQYFFVEGQGNRLHGVPGTLWAAYNGITELVDHRVSDPKRGRVQSKDGRLESTWFGRGSLIKAKAFEVACRFLPGRN